MSIFDSHVDFGVESKKKIFSQLCELPHPWSCIRTRGTPRERTHLINDIIPSTPDIVLLFSSTSFPPSLLSLILRGNLFLIFRRTHLSHPFFDQVFRKRLVTNFRFDRHEDSEGGESGSDCIGFFTIYTSVHLYNRKFFFS